jgi:hypothetical protein
MFRVLCFIFLCFVFYFFVFCLLFVLCYMLCVEFLLLRCLQTKSKEANYGFRLDLEVEVSWLLMVANCLWWLLLVVADCLWWLVACGGCWLALAAINRVTLCPLSTPSQTQGGQ